MQHDDPANVEFRIRPERRTRRVEREQMSGWWWVAVLAGGIVFVLLIRTMLDRSGSTADSPAEARKRVVSVGRDTVPSAPVRATRAATGPTVYRCVDGVGHVSFQSHPCSGGQTTTREIAVFQDFRKPVRRVVSPPDSRGYTTSYSSGPSAYERQRAARRAGCASARRQREQTLEMVGLRRNFDLLRRLDDMVREACKGL